MRHVRLVVLAGSLLLAASGVARASADTALAAASAAGHPVFLIVTDGGATGLDVARRVVADAQKIAPDTSILEMNRADAANAEVVRRYRLATVPVPLVLVIASNGVAAGGARPEAVTAERLADMIPSPAKSSFLKALDEKKAVFLVFARESTPDLAATLKGVADAQAALAGAASVVRVDLASAREAGFVAEMKQDLKSTACIVAVYNAKGQATETFRGAAAPDALVAAARKEVKSSCGPGGCGPDGCK